MSGCIACLRLALDRRSSIACLAMAYMMRLVWLPAMAPLQSSLCNRIDWRRVVNRFDCRAAIGFVPWVVRVQRHSVDVACACYRATIICVRNHVMVKGAQALKVARVQPSMRRILDRHYMVDVHGWRRASFYRALRIALQMLRPKPVPFLALIKCTHFTHFTKLAK